MFLVKNGVPYDVAFSLGPAEKLAHMVALGEDGLNVFDWASMSWRRRD
jgi:hypothetical protein